MMDTLLISLHSSFAAVCTNLSFCTPKPTIKEITSALKKFDDTKTMCSCILLHLTPQSKERLSCKQTKVIIMATTEVGLERNLMILTGGNTKGHDNACFHCGHSGHITQKCIADMPCDVKDHILSQHTHVVTLDDIAYAHLTTNNIDSLTPTPLILSQDQLIHLAPNDPLFLCFLQATKCTPQSTAHFIFWNLMKMFLSNSEQPIAISAMISIILVVLFGRCIGI